MILARREGRSLLFGENTPSPATTKIRILSQMFRLASTTSMVNWLRDALVQPGALRGTF